MALPIVKSPVYSSQSRILIMQREEPQQEESRIIVIPSFEPSHDKAIEDLVEVLNDKTKFWLRKKKAGQVPWKDLRDLYGQKEVFKDLFATFNKAAFKVLDNH